VCCECKVSKAKHLWHLLRDKHENFIGSVQQVWCVESTVRLVFTERWPWRFLWCVLLMKQGKNLLQWWYFVERQTLKTNMWSRECTRWSRKPLCAWAFAGKTSEWNHMWVCCEHDRIGTSCVRNIRRKASIETHKRYCGCNVEFEKHCAGNILLKDIAWRTYKVCYEWPNVKLTRLVVIFIERWGWKLCEEMVQV